MTDVFASTVSSTAAIMFIQRGFVSEDQVRILLYALAEGTHIHQTETLAIEICDRVDMLTHPSSVRVLEILLQDAQALSRLQKKDAVITLARVAFNYEMSDSAWDIGMVAAFAKSAGMSRRAYLSALNVAKRRFLDGRPCHVQRNVKNVFPMIRSTVYRAWKIRAFLHEMRGHP